MAEEIAAKREQSDEDFFDLAPNHRRFVNLYISGQWSLPKLAELMGVSKMTVYRWLDRDDVKAEIRALQEQNQKLVSNQLNNLTIKAVDKLGKLVDSNIDGVSLQAVKDILDRGGHKAKQEIKKEVTITSFEQQLHDVMADTMRDIIDVESTEVE